MGSTLEHGIYLPSEGEKNCYQGLASNWNKVDGALGDIAELKQSIESKFTKEIVTELPTEDINPYCIYMILKTDPETDNVYDEWVYINNAWEYLGNTKVDMTQYYTKQEVNQLPAVASGVTATKVGNYDAHIANGDIHVTASDKVKWNTVALIKQLRLVNAQVGSSTTIAFANIDDTNGIKVGDKCMDLDGKLFEITVVDTTNQTVTVGSALIDLALDANVMHLSGNENVNGTKTFKDMIPIDGDYLGDEASNNQRTNICLRSNRDTANKSCAYISRFRQNKSQGALQTSDLQMIGFDVLENEVRTNNVFSIQCSGWVDNVPTKVKLISSGSYSTLGSSAKPSKINDLNPGSLSFPDLNNGIDISGYITHLDKVVNSYTPSVNGWISIRVKKTSLAHTSLMIYQTGGLLSSCETTEFGISGTNLPVIANQNVEIYIIADSLASAKFYPCLGNV